MDGHALIIGGFGGLGSALAHECGQRKVMPIVTSRIHRETPTELARCGGTAVQMDVTDEGSVRRCVNQLDLLLSQIKYVFYTPGVRLQGTLTDHTPEDIQNTIDVCLTGLIRVMRALLDRKTTPWHMIPIISTTGWRVRDDETAYAAVKAGAAHAARGFYREMRAALPSCRVLVAHPGGMRTNFWRGSVVDTKSFFDPALIAKLLCNEIERQETGDAPPLHEVHYLRSANGEPNIEFGPKAPLY
ncbi:SDR family NAD(P)-dependent oxidoreductase [Patescibacteria group bacterium]|nr:SDR family NAD(P)-dependent oxidoreductase [Patescibacteria group bacterium]